MSSYNFKYRPQKISELDLVAVREGLAQVLSSGKVPHAFLFSGPRGIGKTSAARILAKSVNCIGKREKGDFEPCNSCAACLSITAGNNLDVLEIDAASNRGIDDIRDLREKVKLSPSAARFKVYIIDEAHMLTTEAFNALLKTLEEPPEHVIFILCTTEPEKLPETIISRCTRFNFKKAKDDEVLAKLKKTAEEEKLEVTDEALAAIVKGASGSFRDALKILEQATFVGEKITEEQVEEILGQTLGLSPEKLLEFLVERDTKEAMAEVDRVVQMGGNLRVYTTQLLELLRLVLLTKLEIVSSAGECPAERDLALPEKLEIEEIKSLIEIFGKAALELKEAIIPQLPLELAVVEWCGEGKGAVSQSSHLVSNSAPASDAGPALGPAAPKSNLVDSGALEPASDSINLRSTTVSNAPSGKNVSLEEVQSRWKELLLAVRPRNYSIEAFLRAARPVNFDNNNLVIEVFYQFHRDKLDSEKCRSIVEEVASEMFGAPIKMKYTLGERPTPQKVPETEIFSPDNGGYKEKGSNGETEDEDILKVAEKIFNGKGQG